MTGTATQLARPVDTAMLAQRDEKKTVRKFWLQKAEEHAGKGTASTPLYFTLPGAAATEVNMLIAAGLIKMEENGAIHKDSAHALVCLEYDQKVYLEIQRKYSGLKIIRANVEEFIHGNSRIRFPTGEQEKYCRSKVVNLDLNETWSPKFIQDDALVPVLTWIQKFGAMHERDPRVEWSLLLTLHGECPWDDQQANLMQHTLLEILSDTSECREQLKQWLGEEVFDQITSGGFTGFRTLQRDIQQKLLMWLVPAMISEQCHKQGWAISVAKNLYYGSEPVAPMVTWVIDFSRTEQKLNYRAEHNTCLKTILNNTGFINPDGTISH